MSESLKKRLCPPLISPTPRRAGQVLGALIKRNPFSELPPLKQPGLPEQDSATRELHQILSKPLTLPPMKKSSPNFFNRNEKIPVRQKNNPLIFDEKFIELNSSLSTCQSWTEAVPL
jgi:hypothetical protein